MEMEVEEDVVKENPGLRLHGARALRRLGYGAVASLLSLALVLLLDRHLPEPLTRSAPKDSFIAEIAHEYLVNLTAIGPRVAGTYENDVATVRVLLEALHEIKRNANHHHRLEIDVHHADGAFPIAFLDGMNNVYRGVGMVGLRVRAAGGAKSGGKRARAVLLNCHYDTVPDSPGASDDGAGCAVLLEVARALAAGAAPLRHDVIFLWNGAEENIMQASHAFVTTHRWARDVRAFINIEACGAGGREVLFQAGPHDPWIVEVYTASVPHPFASSLAQELFESGLVPADTDFRVFRDFGNLSGVDLAWSANGYVYHTALDAAAAVPGASLQRTGDNVLALLRGLLLSEQLGLGLEAAPLPVYFDVLGRAGVALRGGAALAAAAALLLAALRSLLTPPPHSFLGAAAWRRLLLRTSVYILASGAAGGAAAAAGGLAGGMLWYACPALLAPLAALPAVCVSWLVLWRLWAGSGAGGAVGGAVARGAGVKALILIHSVVLLAAVVTGHRSGFLPGMWLAALLGVDAAAGGAGGAGSPLQPASWALPWLVGMQIWYVSSDLMQMLLPVAGRAGAAQPAHILVPGLAGLLALAASSWLLPLLLAAPRPQKLIYPVLCACALVMACCAMAPLSASYSPTRPQRHMVFHTRRTLHDASGGQQTEHVYWMPHLDRNSPHSLAQHVPELSEVTAMSAEDCGRLAYCGAPYYLPVLSFISRASWAPAPKPGPADQFPELVYNATAHVEGRRCRLMLHLTGGAHVVVVVSAWRGGWLEGASLLAGGVAPRPSLAPLLPNATYMFTLHAAHAQPTHWALQLDLEYPEMARAGECASLSLAGHDMAGGAAGALGRLLASFPAWTAPTGWPVDLHLATL